MTKRHKETKLLFHARSNVAYTSRHILYVRDRMLMAQAFDEKRLGILGQPFPIAGQVQYDELTWRGVFFHIPPYSLCSRSDAYGTGI